MRHLAIATRVHLVVAVIAACTLLAPTEARACDRLPFCRLAIGAHAIIVTRTVLPSHDVLGIRAPYNAPFHIEIARDGILETPELGNAMDAGSDNVTYSVPIGHLGDDDTVTIAIDCSERHLPRTIAVSTIPADDTGDLDAIALDRIALILGFVILVVGALARPRIAILAIPDRDYLPRLRCRVRLPRARIHRRRP